MTCGVENPLVLHTKWGTAKVNSNGYYAITSSKEGNCFKKIHRLLFEDFYDMEIPDGYVIHHKNGNKLDNCILNLQMLPDFEHRSLHNNGANHPMYGKHHTEESKKKISEAGKGRKVSVETRKKISDANKGKTLSEEHKQKLRESRMGMKHSEETKRKMSESRSGENHPLYGVKGENHHWYGKSHSEESCIKISKSQNSSGYYRVAKVKRKKSKQGFYWRYQYYDENKKQKFLNSVDIKKLEKKVKSLGLKWIKYDEEVNSCLN